MSQEEVLEAWCAELLEHLEISGTPIDIDAVLALAGKAAHTVIRPAAPLTTFIAGYAAGLAAGSGQAGDSVSLNSAMAVASRVLTSKVSAGKAAPAPDA